MSRRAFARAAHVVEVEVTVERHTAVPMETRGLVADFDAALGRLTLWGATKVPHFNRDVLAGLLGIEERQIARARRRRRRRLRRARGALPRGLPRAVAGSARSAGR